MLVVVILGAAGTGPALHGVTATLLGLGDVKLAIAVGLALGTPTALMAIVLTTVLGALLAIAALLTHRRRQSIPYGPAMVAGALLALLVVQSG